MKEEPWKSDPLVQRLGLRRGAAAFSNPKASVGYITGLLRRLNLRRRRVTSAAKQRPPDEAIRAHQKEMQTSLEGLPPAAVVSGDETAWCWGVKPRYQYVPVDVSADGRGTAPESDEKQRWVTAVCGIEVQHALRLFPRGCDSLCAALVVWGQADSAFGVRWGRNRASDVLCHQVYREQTRLELHQGHQQATRSGTLQQVDLVSVGEGADPGSEWKDHHLDVPPTLHHFLCWSCHHNATQGLE
jgi:hypothetical protein